MIFKMIKIVVKTNDWFNNHCELQCYVVAAIAAPAACQSRRSLPPGLGFYMQRDITNPFGALYMVSKERRITIQLASCLLRQQ